MIKKILFSILFMMIGYCSFGQSGMYLVTDQHSVNGITDVSRVVVTDPQGNSTMTNLTHIATNLEDHFSELNIIFNEIMSLGYTKLVPLDNDEGAITTLTWAFLVP